MRVLTKIGEGVCVLLLYVNCSPTAKPGRNKGRSELINLSDLGGKVQAPAVGRINGNIVLQSEAFIALLSLDEAFRTSWADRIFFLCSAWFTSGLVWSRFLLF